ncbi:hypothetical protein PQR68_07360 [Paraburkholderia agricolaris]|uniref:hypothetical protein n=1 Tax=Paraburkholderia agricolaris TaxID=2152888 RepID=UPI0038B87F69
MTAQAGFLGLLDHWQTLVGSLLGGALGVIGAWIVATMTIRRQRWIAASALLPDTQQLIAAHEALENALGAVEPPIAGWHQPQWRAERLMRRRPMVQVLHDRATLTQVTDLDARLSAHLTHCRMAHVGFEELLDEFTQTLNTSRAPGVDVPAAVEAVRRRAARVNQAWDLCSEHAALATYFMDRFIFNRWPNLLHRLRMKLCRNDLDKRSAYLLKTGSLLTPPDTGAAQLDDEHPV